MLEKWKMNAKVRTFQEKCTRMRACAHTHTHTNTLHISHITTITFRGTYTCNKRTALFTRSPNSSYK